MTAKQFKVRLQIVVEPDEGGFYAYCPELPGLHVGGDTEQEALANAREAATAYIASLLKHDDPLPVGAQVHSDHGHLEELLIAA